MGAHDASNDVTQVAASSDVPSADSAGSYEKPKVKTLEQSDVLSAVNKGSKFPARGFAG